MLDSSIMDANYSFATRDDIWRLQEDLKDIYATQAHHTDRISRLEKRKEEDTRMKGLWGPQSPFPGGIASTPQTGTSNPIILSLLY